MTYYTNNNSASGLAAVEFIPRPDSNVAFFYAKSAETAKRLEVELAGLGQEILSKGETAGRPIIITRGTSTQEELMAELAKRGETLVLRPPKSEFHAWEWRGHFSDAGQGLTLASAKFFEGKKIEEDKMAFAALNLTANWVNKKYGAQKAEDVHQLNYLKKHLNEIIAPSLLPGVQLPAIDDSRAELRSEPPKKKTFGDKFDDFMKQNSVRLGEIGLRYLGSIALIFSYPQLKAMGTIESIVEKDVTVNGEKKKIQSLVKKFDWSKAWETMKSEPWSEAKGLLNKKTVLRNTGLLYLTGKTIGLVFAKTPDPFDPKPKSAFETFREKYAFRVSSVIETVAAATLGVGSFNKRNAKGQRDWLGGLGGTSLTGGLVTRFFAPYGVKQVDKKELDAHIVDSIAMVPEDKRPEVLAKAVTFLKTHFKDTPETYGEVFTRLKDKMYHDRGLSLYSPPVQQPPAEQPQAVTSLGVQQEPQLPISQSDNAMLKSMGIATEPVTADVQKTFADDRLRKPRADTLTPVTHTERASQPAEAQAGISG